MTCEQIQTWFEELSLSRDKAGKYAPVHEHIAHCPTCQPLWRQWLRHDALLRDGFAPTAAPVHLWENIMAAVDTVATLDPGDMTRQTLLLEVVPQGVQRLVLHDPDATPLPPPEVTGALQSLRDRAQQQLAEYFRGERAVFQIPLALEQRSAFERAVLEATATIPYGDVRSYAWIAATIGRPKAMRAVGNALHKNPVPILIPCHRVVKSDGSLGGYAFGEAWKTRLLTLEQQTTPFIGCSTTRILCYRGCHHEQRAHEGHRIHFASVDDALESGYRPCKACHPASL